jgi:hypothetical protein
MKTLKQILEAAKKPEVPQPSAPIEPDSITAFVPKTKDEKRFMDKHVVQKKDDANGNGDDVFRASNINYSDRTPTRHGYNAGEDQKVYEEKNVKTLAQVLGEKHLTPAEKKKREDIAQGIEKSSPGMSMGKKMAIATAKAKQVAEEVEDLDEAVRHEQYATYHAGVKDMLKKIGEHVDGHKEAAMSPTEYNKEKGASMHSGHVYAMKNLHRTLQDMHDDLQQAVEYAKPPKPIKMKEELDLFACFSEETKKQVEQVFEQLDDDNKQIIIEMIEAEDYDTVVEVVQEVLNA